MDAADERAFDLALHLAQREEREEPSDVTDSPDLLILNQPISDFAVFAQLWTRSRYRLCADGGANRLYDMFCGELQARRDDFVGILGFRSRNRIILTANRYQIRFMGTLIRCATMCAPTMLIVGLKFLRIPINIAPISEKPCRKSLLITSPHPSQLREKFLCLELWPEGLIKALECCTR